MKGWYKEYYRHSLAAKGIQTSFSAKRNKYDFAVLGFITAEKKDARDLPIESFRKYAEKGTDGELLDMLKTKEINEAMRSVLLDELHKRGFTDKSMSLAAKESTFNPEGLNFSDLIKWSGAFLTGSIDEVTTSNGKLIRNGTEGAEKKCSFSVSKHSLVPLPLGELNPMVHIKRHEDFDKEQLGRAEDILNELRDLKLVEGRKPSVVAAFITASIKNPDFSKTAEISREFDIYPMTLRNYNREFIDRVEQRKMALRLEGPMVGNLAAKRVFKKGKYHATLSGPEVKRLASGIRAKLKPLSKKIEIAGSIRRLSEKEPIDVDLVMIPKNKEVVRSKLANLGKITRSGKDMVETKIKGVDVDVYFTEPKSYGASLLTYTGSFGHNIGLRQIARKQGKILNQRGIFDRKTGRYLAGRTEREIYTELERPRFKQPEERQ